MCIDGLGWLVGVVGYRAVSRVGRAVYVYVYKVQYPTVQSVGAMIVSVVIVVG